MFPTDTYLLVGQQTQLEIVGQQNKKISHQFNEEVVYLRIPSPLQDTYVLVQNNEITMEEPVCTFILLFEDKTHSHYVAFFRIASFYSFVENIVDSPAIHTSTHPRTVTDSSNESRILLEHAKLQCSASVSSLCTI